MLERHLEMLETGEMGSGINVSHVLIDQDIQRLKSQINELDELLAEHSRD